MLCVRLFSLKNITYITRTSLGNWPLNPSQTRSSRITSTIHQFDHSMCSNVHFSWTDTYQFDKWVNTKKRSIECRLLPKSDVLPQCSLHPSVEDFRLWLIWAQRRHSVLNAHTLIWRWGSSECEHSGDTLSSMHTHTHNDLSHDGQKVDKRRCLLLRLQPWSYREWAWPWFFLQFFSVVACQFEMYRCAQNTKLLRDLLWKMLCELMQVTLWANISDRMNYYKWRWELMQETVWANASDCESKYKWLC
jgi:hypothetical protein